MLTQQILATLLHNCASLGKTRPKIITVVRKSVGSVAPFSLLHYLFFLSTFSLFLSPFFNLLSLVVSFLFFFLLLSFGASVLTHLLFEFARKMVPELFHL